MTEPHTPVSGTTTSSAAIALAWLVVLVPIVWGLWQTFLKVVELFK